MNEKLEIIKEQEVFGKTFCIFGTFEEPLFLAKEIAEMIDYQKTKEGYFNVSKMVQKVDDDEKITIQIMDSETKHSHKQIFLTENGLYEVLMLGRTDICKEFKKEVKKILHELRTTGSYSTKKIPSNAELMATLTQNLAILTNLAQNNAIQIQTMSVAMEQQKSKVDDVDSRLAKIEQKVEERQALLPPPSIKPRDRINMIVRDFADSTKDYQSAWNELYRQFAYRTNTNPKLCAKNRGMTVIDYIETEGQLDILESVALEIFKK